MQSLFFVAHEGAQLGPFSLDEILQKIETKELDPNDYIYDEASQDWIVLMAYPALSEKMKAMKPSLPPKAAVVKQEDPPMKEPTQAEWFILKGDKKFGPFAYTDVVKMLQDKSVFEYDYVWFKGLKNWMRIAEIPEFAPEKIRELKSSKLSSLTELFFRRRHARVAYGGSILVHDKTQVWKGHSVEISEGGAGISVENALLQPGQTIHLHFKPADGLPPFNAVCEIISKKFAKVEDKNSSVQYGVRFIGLTQQSQEQIKDFTGRKVKKAA